MIYSLSGKLIVKTNQFIVLDVNGIGFKALISKQALDDLPPIGSTITILTSLFIKKDGVEICGFLNPEELEIFELLNSISGVGPKTALGILGAVKIDHLLAAIGQGRADAIIQNSNIGKKKAERIVLELKDKIKSSGNISFEAMADVKDLKLALKNIGYNNKQIDEAIAHLPKELKTIEEKLKAALKILTRK